MKSKIRTLIATSVGIASVFTVSIAGQVERTELPTHSHHSAEMPETPEPLDIVAIVEAVSAASTSAAIQNVVVDGDMNAQETRVFLRGLAAAMAEGAVAGTEMPDTDETVKDETLETLASYAAHAVAIGTAKGALENFQDVDMDRNLMLYSIRQGALDGAREGAETIGVDPWAVSVALLDLEQNAYGYLPANGR